MRRCAGVQDLLRIHVWLRQFGVVSRLPSLTPLCRHLFGRAAATWHTCWCTRSCAASLHCGYRESERVLFAGRSRTACQATMRTLVLCLEIISVGIRPCCAFAVVQVAGLWNLRPAAVPLKSRCTVPLTLWQPKQPKLPGSCSVSLLRMLCVSCGAPGRCSRLMSGREGLCPPRMRGISYRCSKPARTQLLVPAMRPHFLAKLGRESARRMHARQLAAVHHGLSMEAQRNSRATCGTSIRRSVV